MPIAASSNAAAPKSDISQVLKRWRDVDRATTSAIERTLETGSPVASRSASCTATLIADGRSGGAHHPANRVDAQVESDHRVGHLHRGRVHRRPRLVVEAAVAGVADDADDLALGLGGELAHHAAAEHEAFADRAPVGPVLPGHRLVDDGHRRGQRVVAVGEDAALPDRNLEHVEVAGADRQPPGAAVERRIGERPAGDHERQPEPAFERHATRRRGRGHAGQRAQPLEAARRRAGAGRRPWRSAGR